MRQKINKKGYILLVLLFAIAILALLYMIDINAMFGPAKKTGSYAEKPWLEERRLLHEDKFPIEQTGKKGKVVIKSQTKLLGTARHNNQSRGNIEITIDPNGRVYGSWKCTYEYTDSSYALSAEFVGNIDPAKIYEDRTGVNRQLLYFITKGKYQQTKTDKASGNQWQSQETIYVTGWIDRDFSAQGKLFLMTAEGGNVEYDWQTNLSSSDYAGKN